MVSITRMLASLGLSGYAAPLTPFVTQSAPQRFGILHMSPATTRLAILSSTLYSSIAAGVPTRDVIKMCVGPGC